MNWLIILLVVLALGIIFVVNYREVQTELTAKPTIQYTKPIGPTQTYPYKLSSSPIGNNHG